MNSKTNRLKGIEFREGREQERFAFLKTMHRGFSGHFNADPGRLEYNKAGWAPMSNSVCAFDGDEIVGTTSWVGFELTVPGGKMEFMGVTDVTVAATHTRRGIMREMMRRVLVKGRDAGQHTAGLWASESNIYGRFGYGMSGEVHIAKIDTRDSRFRVMPKTTGEVRFADHVKMRQVAPVLWQKSADRHIGMMLRPDAEWDWIYDAQRIRRLRDRRPFHVTYAEDGEHLGYATYRIQHRDDDLHSTNLVRVDELIAATASAEAALWRFLLDIDLATELVDNHHPKKSNLLWLLADPRKLSLTPYDSVWIRILDPVKSLTSRTYSSDGEVAIKVVDKFCPWTEGVYILTADQYGNATCVSTDRAPDITMSVAALGSIYMGAMQLSDIARAGGITEHKSGSVAHIDRMFTISGVHSFLPDF